MFCSILCCSASVLQSYDYHELEVDVFEVSDVKRKSVQAKDPDIVDDIDDEDYGDYDRIDELRVVMPKNKQFTSKFPVNLKTKFKIYQ